MTRLMLVAVDLDVADVDDVRVVDERREPRLRDELVPIRRRPRAGEDAGFLIATSCRKPSAPRTVPTHTVAIPPEASLTIVS